MEVKYPWECSLNTGERLLLRDSARLSTLNTDYGHIGSLLRYWARHAAEHEARVPVDVDVQLLAYKLASAKHVHSISGIGRNEVKVLRQRALFA